MLIRILALWIVAALDFLFFFFFFFEPGDAAAVEQTLVKRGLLWRARGPARQQRGLGFCFLCRSNDLQDGVSQATATC